MSIRKNISAVAHYESKLLGRSWFFRIFALLQLVVIGLITVSANQNTQVFGVMMEQAPSMYAYVVCVVMNILQSVVIIFLSGDYLKRDKQLDTSEVFYVRPLSNAEYLIGKMWGTLKRFIAVDVLLMGVFFVLGRFVAEIQVSPLDFANYFVLMILPSVIFIIGVSTAMMLIIGNQALTFVTILALAALSVFYVGDLYYNIFDIFAMELPMFRSPLIGYTNIEFLLPHRLIYICIGLASILLSIFLFKRLAGRNSARYKWLVFALALYGVGGYMSFDYLQQATRNERVQREMMALNDTYLGYPKLRTTHYDMNVEHLGESIHSSAELRGVMSKDGSQLVFSLNSGMRVDSVLDQNNKNLEFQRHGHIILTKLPELRKEGDSLSLRFVYEGGINRDEMFVDVTGEVRDLKNEAVEGMVQVDKVAAVIDPGYVVLTPESYWYPRSGVSYTNSTPNWSSEYFSRFDLKVKPMAGLVPVSQGTPEMMADSLSWNFKSDYPYRAISLAIADYQVYTCPADSVNPVTFSAYVHRSHTGMLDVLSPIHDTIPKLLVGMLEMFEGDGQVDYTFDRFTLVDVPEQIFSYPRDWSTTQELMQPELTFIAGAGFRDNWGTYNFEENLKQRKMHIDRGWAQPASDTVILSELFEDQMWGYLERSENTNFESAGMGQFKTSMLANPYYLPAVIFNSNYNIYSDSISWGARLIEHLVDPSTENNDWIRGANGLSPNEQALLLLQEAGADSYLNNPMYSSNINEITSAMGNLLFSEARAKMGVEPFQKMMDTLMKNNLRANISFEALLDSIEARTGTNIADKLPLTREKLTLPAFYVRSVSQGEYESENGPIYSYEYVAKNISSVAGYVEFYLVGQGTNHSFLVHLEPGQLKRVVKHFPINYFYHRANTLNSYNLPQLKSLRIEDAKPSKVPPKEGEFIIEEKELFLEKEIIVDNENEELFSVSAPPASGYMNAWIDRSMEHDFKYKGVWGRPPFRWTPVTDQRFYGDAILSAMTIRSGDGSQNVQWKIPIPEAGRYAFYCTASYPREMRWRRGRGRKLKPTYEFTINTGEREEITEVDLSTLNRNDWISTWVWINDYQVNSDTVTITLSNRSDLWTITADAVKAVRMD